MATKPATVYSTNPKMVAGGMSPYSAMDALEQTKKDPNNRCSDWK